MLWAQTLEGENHKKKGDVLSVKAFVQNATGRIHDLRSEVVIGKQSPSNAGSVMRVERHLHWSKRNRLWNMLLFRKPPTTISQWKRLIVMLQRHCISVKIRFFPNWTFLANSVKALNKSLMNYSLSGPGTSLLMERPSPSKRTRLLCS